MKIKNREAIPAVFSYPKLSLIAFLFSRPRSILPVSFGTRPALIRLPFRKSPIPECPRPKAPGHRAPQNTLSHPKTARPSLPAFLSLFPTTRLPSRKVSARQPRRLQNLRPSTLRPTPPPTPYRPAPLDLVSFFHTLILPFFCGRKGRLRRAAFPRGAFFFRRLFCSVSRSLDWSMRPICIRSIGQCVRFAFARLVNASDLHPLDWPMRPFYVHSIGPCVRFASIRLTNIRSPVGGDLLASVRCRCCVSPRCMIE